MILSDSKKLVNYVRSLRDFKIYQIIDGNYVHIGATVADAVLQANNKYEANVKPRINRILNKYKKPRTTSSVLRLLKSISTIEYLNWNGLDRADRFKQILELFKTESVEDEKDLKKWLLQESNLQKLISIKGIGPKTIDYFKILVGISTSAIDRHLLNFLSEAGLSPCSYSDAQTIINSTADILSIDRACFDHSIWQFMSKRKTVKQPGCTKDNCKRI